MYGYLELNSKYTGVNNAISFVYVLVGYLSSLFHAGGQQQ